MRSLFIALALAGCVADATDGAPAAPNQLQDDDKADGGLTLWAGLTSFTFERYSTDPCDDGRNAVGDQPIVWDEWVRERAAIRNVCFEVWSPGITDVDNPDYWKLLDVQVHYRVAGGAWQMAYVPSIDQRWHNRRYAWSIPYALDAFSNPAGASITSLGAPLSIVSEQNGWALVDKDVEYYFTVNGRKLQRAGGAFTLRFEGYARESTLAPNSAGYVLHDEIDCDGLRVGSGAGFFAIDVHSAAAVAALQQPGATYGAQVAASSALVSATFSSEYHVDGEALYALRDGAGARVEPHGTTMRVELDVYDRSADQVRTLSASFANCAAVGQ